MSVHPLYDEETEGDVYCVVPTRHTESISDITSETESALSSMTVGSDDALDYFITHHGRQQPASENALRWLPTDNTRRDILRHVVEKYMFGCNYLGPVQEILDSDPGVGRQHHVLEIGTRSGTWIQEMATEFPHVQFRSLDIAPLVPHLPRSNIVFEVYDIAKGILIEDNSQDVVFITRGLDLMKNYQAVLVEAHRVLRPGGLIHMREFLPGVWDKKDSSKPAAETNPMGCRFFDLIRSAIRKSGSDPDACIKLPQWLSPDSELWKNSDHPRGFEQTHSTVKIIPPCPHVGYPCASHIDPQMILLIGHFVAVCIRDSVSLLCDAGLSDEEAKLLAEDMIVELNDPEKCPLLKWYTMYARKTCANC